MYDVIGIFCKCVFFKSAIFFPLQFKKIIIKMKHLPLAETVKDKLSNTRAHK